VIATPERLNTVEITLLYSRPSWAVREPRRAAEPQAQARGREPLPAQAQVPRGLAQVRGPKPEGAGERSLECRVSSVRPWGVTKPEPCDDSETLP